MKLHLDQMNPLNRIRDAKILDGIHSAPEFAAILNRERDRADRTGQEFSLVAFEVGTEFERSDSARHLVHILIHGIRSTDEIGWLEDGPVGVVLPHTSPEGAWKFVAKVRNSYNGTLPPPNCRVYSYPSWWLSTGNGRASRKPDAGQGTTFQEGSGGSGTISEAEYSAHPIEELESQFLCRIPAWKRAIDVAGALIALILLAPLFLLVALFIKIVSPGPVFFRQERVGYMGKTFTIWKFRTMHRNADTTVHRQYLRDLINNENRMTKLDDGKDGRIIPFGKVLRATGIDELPQLINVLSGEMSLIGPRPCLAYEAREFSSWQTRRFDTVPGLTGLWQVSGKNRTTFKEMMRLDIAYARKRAFLLDARIFLKTIPAIIDQVADRASRDRVRARRMAVAARLGIFLLGALTLYGLLI